MRPRSTRTILSLATLALPVSASAQIINGSLNATDYTWTGSNSVFGMFGTIVELMIGVASVLAAIFFMYAGYLYLTSAGDTAKINQAHKIFKDVGWGFVLLLSAWLIVVSILQALEAQSWLLKFFGVSR